MDEEAVEAGGGTLYTENPIPGGTRTLVIGLAAGVAGVAIGVGADLAALVAVAGTIALLSLLLLSTLRYLSISLDHHRLTVGRHHIPLAEIDRAYGIHNGEDVLDQATLVSLEDPAHAMTKRGRRGDLKILGGGYGRPMNGSRWLVIQERTGTRYVIASRHRDRLASSLDLALRG